MSGIRIKENILELFEEIYKSITKDLRDIKNEEVYVAIGKLEGLAYVAKILPEETLIQQLPKILDGYIAQLDEISKLVPAIKNSIIVYKSKLETVSDYISELTKEKPKESKPLPYTTSLKPKEEPESSKK